MNTVNTAPRPTLVCGSGRAGDQNYPERREGAADTVFSVFPVFPVCGHCTPKTRRPGKRWGGRGIAPLNNALSPGLFSGKRLQIAPFCGII